MYVLSSPKYLQSDKNIRKRLVMKGLRCHRNLTRLQITKLSIMNQIAGYFYCTPYEFQPLSLPLTFNRKFSELQRAPAVFSARHEQMPLSSAVTFVMRTLEPLSNILILFLLNNLKQLKMLLANLLMSKKKLFRDLQCSQSIS